MDPLERAQRVIARASEVCAVASQVLPARARLKEELATSSQALTSLRSSLRSHIQTLSQSRADFANAEAAAACSRARLIQLMRYSAELLDAVETDWAGIESVPGLSGEPVVPIDDPALPHGVQAPLRERAREPTVGVETGVRGARAAPSVLARPDVMRAAAGGLGMDRVTLVDGYVVLKGAMEQWANKEMALRQKKNQR